MYYHETARADQWVSVAKKKRALVQADYLSTQSGSGTQVTDFSTSGELLYYPPGGPILTEAPPLRSGRCAGIGRA